MAFELIRTSSGWKHNVLHSFGLNGQFPEGGLVLDQVGNLYGTTRGGGSKKGAGIVFELRPTSSGPWKEIVLHEFRGSRHFGSKDGRTPVAELIFDAQGNLYGTTLAGGPHGGGNHQGVGVIFKLSWSSSGWKETILHYGGHKGGFDYIAGLVFDSAGNLYGTSSGGGVFNHGVVFRLTPTKSGFWKETVLHTFGASNDGLNPACTLVLGAGGNLYGTTTFGGKYSLGTVFEVAP